MNGTIWTSFGGRCMRRSVPFIFFVVFQASLSPAGMIMTPYLQALTPTSVFVLVECDSRDSVTVQYGLKGDFGASATTGSIAATTDSPSTYVHRIPLEGLIPGAEYFYRAGQGGVFSRAFRFRAGVLPGHPFRFAWVADDRNGPEVFYRVLVRAAAARPLLALYGGDLCPGTTYESWKTGFFVTPQMIFGASVPWVNSPGNHEKWTTNTQAFTHGPVGSASQEFFSFDCGDMHVLVLNSELPLGAGTSQYAFADADLHGTNRQWKVVMVHKPAYCAGGHGEDSSMIALSSAVFETTGVDLVLTGHSHFYQHNLVNGIHHMVIGSAGAPLYDPAHAWYTQKSAKEYNWAVADVRPESLSLFVYNERGMPLDTLLLKK
jgi:hypothetical protein